VSKKKPAPHSSGPGSCRQGGLELLAFSVPALVAKVVTWGGNPKW